MTEVSLLRVTALRVIYGLIALAMGSMVWPELLLHVDDWPLTHGVAQSMLAALSLVALLGIRYPLQMLPLLFFELAWKTIWLVVIALPLWRSGQVDAATAEAIKACAMVVIVPIAMPWRYVFERFVRQPGDRWMPDAAKTSWPG